MQFTGKLLFVLGDNMSSLWQNNWIIRAFIFCRSEIRVVDPSLRLESALISDKANSGCECRLAVLKNDCYPPVLPNVCGSFLPGSDDLRHEGQSVLRTQSCTVLGSLVPERTPCTLCLPWYWDVNISTEVAHFGQWWLLTVSCLVIKIALIGSKNYVQRYAQVFISLDFGIQTI